MEDKNITKKAQVNNNNAVIFGTSSDDIQQGLDHGQFIEAAYGSGIDEKDQVVNEEEQNEIVNPSEENFNEELAPHSPKVDTTSVPVNSETETEGEQVDEK